jgi:diadenosine tetraphosphate (Ap4A) HIT family hydrolase
MPADAHQFYARALAVADADGRLPLSQITDWDIFPFETDGLTVTPLAAPELPEPARYDAGGVGCGACAAAAGVVWQDEHWLLVTTDPSCSPLRLMLISREHVDFPGLPDDRAAELGLLLVHVVRAIEALPNIARAHIARWGDGGEHMHTWFFARPEGVRQMLGTVMPIWDDLMPPVPVAERDADARAVAAALVGSYGGSAVGS